MILVVGNLGSGKSLYSSLFIKQGLAVREFDDGIGSDHCDVFVTQRKEEVEKLNPSEVHHVQQLVPPKLFGLSFPPVFRVTVYKRHPQLGFLTEHSIKRYSLKFLMGVAVSCNPEYQDRQEKGLL